MDVLSDILSALRLQGVLYFSTDFRPPWGLRVPLHRRVARFHLVVRGSCWVRVVAVGNGADDELVHIETGDLILIPHGAEHVLADTPDTPCRTVDDAVREAGFTGRGALVMGDEDTGAPTRMVCGHFEFDEAINHQMLAQLPRAMVIRWDEMARDSPLENAFRYIAREVQDGRPGHDAVARRLSEVLFVEVVRVWAGRANGHRGLLAALVDPRLGEALEAMHADPAQRWTLESLGRKAAMGRTGFAERFRDVVGETPLQYLTSWRMQHAKRLLTESNQTIDEIAEQVGYDSGSSFSRVFSKTTGVAPGAFRKERVRGESRGG